ncbi:MAG: hypothetical protein R3F21_24365 [Myxococcota bacterium]
MPLRPLLAPPHPIDPGAFPAAVLALCERLEDTGIAAVLQGERLVEAWLGAPAVGARAWSLVCAAQPEALLRALPAAVVTAASAARLSQATIAGPVDLIATGPRDLEATLAAFGLAPLAVGFRPRDARWHAPGGVLEALACRRFDRIPDHPNPFLGAPRRYWLAARWIAEYDLEPTPALVEAARAALPEVGARLPEGAPARRVLGRILDCPQPARALAFLRDSGALEHVLPGIDPGAGARITALAEAPDSLRWAAFLRGTSTARALARLRMPTALARRIGRVLEAHPLDRTHDGARDPQLRRAMTRLSPEELDGLIRWRCLELDEAAATSDVQRERDRLAKVEAGIARLRSQASSQQSVRALALGGAEVMQRLGAGPGPWIGRALAHLARFVAADPERNTPERLIAELREWQAGEAAESERPPKRTSS